MKAVLLISMSGCPALAVPAGFGASGLPMGIQIVAPVHRELDCLYLAYAHTIAAKIDPQQESDRRLQLRFCRA
jgi:amidase